MTDSFNKCSTTTHPFYCGCLGTDPFKEKAKKLPPVFETCKKHFEIKSCGYWHPVLTAQLKCVFCELANLRKALKEVAEAEYKRGRESMREQAERIAEHQGMVYTALLGKSSYHCKEIATAIRRIELE